MTFNGPERDLQDDDNQQHLTESTYCPKCGTIYVRGDRGPHGWSDARECPACTLAVLKPRLDQLEQRVAALEDDGEGDSDELINETE